MGRTLKEPQDIRRALEDIKEVVLTMPTERTSITDIKIRENIFEKYIEIWSKRELIYRQNKSSMFSVVLGQSLEAMRSKLESESTFETISNKSNVIKLLELIHNIVFAYESKRYPYLAVYTAMKTLYGNYQRNYMGIEVTWSCSRILCKW